MVVMRTYCVLDLQRTPLASVDLASATCHSCEDDIRRSRDGRLAVLRLVGETLPAFTDGHMIFSDETIRKYLQDNADQW